MYEVSKCSGQEALRDLEKAFKRFFEYCHKKKAGKLIECGYLADRDYNAAKNIAKLA